jgi:hypothetical protein
MHKRCHLVALNKPFSQIFPLFIVRLSILNVITSFMVSWSPKLKQDTKTKTLCNTFALISIGLVFSFFFSKLITWSSCHVHLPHHGLESCSTPRLYQPHLIHTLKIEVSTKVSSISQNQTRVFKCQANTLDHAVNSSSVAKPNWVRA